jgi:hypothetical protein
MVGILLNNPETLFSGIKHFGKNEYVSKRE